MILNLLINKIKEFFINCLRLYFIYEYSSTEILVYKFVMYGGL